MAVTGIYPPTVSTATPSFLRTGNAKIYFTLGSNTTDKTVRFIHLSLKNQLTGKTAFKIVKSEEQSSDNTTTLTQYSYPEILVYAFNEADLKESSQSNLQLIKSENSMYYIEIPSSIVNSTDVWDIGSTYVAQLRGDISTDRNPIDYCYCDNSNNWTMDNSTSYTDYFNNDLDSFIEWSDLIQIIPIGKPTVYLDLPENMYPFDNIIKGKVVFADDNREKISSYKIEIKADGKTVYSSGDIATVNQYDRNQINKTIDLSYFLNNSATNIQLIFTYTTSHGYQGSETKDLEIQSCTALLDTSYKIEVEENKSEFGIAEIKITYPNAENKKILIKRGSSLSLKMDDIFELTPSAADTTIIYDNTIESLAQYTYNLYLQDTNDSSIQGPISSNPLIPEFYGSILSDNEHLLKISYDFDSGNDTANNKLTKVDTVGGKYPMFARNAAIDYHTLSISGIIAIEDNYDEDGDISQFLNFDFPEILTSLKQADGRNSNYSNYNYLLQREFRKKTMDWLNNGKPKLFRSLPLGNFVVMLSDISMTPKDGTSSLVWTVSATAYEIGDGEDYSTLQKYNIV